LRWKLPKNLQKKPLLLYRQRPDREKSRLLTKDPIQRATTEGQVLEILGTELDLMTKDPKQPPNRNMEEKDRANQTIFGKSDWGKMSKSDRQKKVMDLILKDAGGIAGIVSMFFPKFAKALGVFYFDDTAIIPMTYTYVLKLKSNGKTIASKKIKTNKTPKISAPEDVKGEAGNFEVFLTWKPLSAVTGVLGYNVYRHTHRTGDFTKITELPVLYTEASTGRKKKTEPVVNFNDFFVENGIDYWYFIRTVHFSGELSPPSKKVKVRPVDNRKPRSVVMTKTEQQKNGKVKIWWEFSKSKNVAFYEIHRSHSKDGKYLLINKTPVPQNKNFYEDRIEKLGGSYWYKVRAVNSRKIFSDFSVPLPCHPKRITKPVRVKMIKTIPGLKFIEVHWQRSSDKFVKRYHIMRSEEKSGKYFQHGTAKRHQTKWVDKNVQDGISYYYAIVAVDKFANKSVVGDSVIGLTLDRRAPLTPGGLKALVFENTITLSWVPNFSKNLAGFNIYKRTNGAGTFKLLNTSPISKKENEYKDKIKTGQTKLEYKITAVSSDKLESKKSAARTAIPWKTKLPAPFLNMVLPTTKQGQNAVLVQWKRYQHKSLRGFHIFRAEVGKDFIRLTQKLLSKRARTFTDTSLKKDARYGYYVSAIDLSNNQSKKSNTKYIHIK